MVRAILTCSRHPFRADNDVATAVCDRALLFASVWLSAGQSQEPDGTVAATEERRTPNANGPWLGMRIPTEKRTGKEPHPGVDAANLPRIY
jgi:hypothetical protein